MKFVLFSLFETIIRNIGGTIGRRIRFQYYKRRFAYCGKNVVIDIGVIIENPSKMFVGNNVWLDNHVILMAGFITNMDNVSIKKNLNFNEEIGEVHIGDFVHIAPFSVIQGHGGIYIGSKSGIASGSKIYSLSHHYRNLNDRNDTKQYYFTPMVEMQDQFFVASPVYIGEGSAIGLNSVILPGTTIPDGTWVGVNTYMTGSGNLENSVYATSAAIFIKKKN
jgi:galactoside O-acetyltransferase